MNSNEHIFRGTHGPRLGEKGFGPVNGTNHYDKGNQFSHSMKKNTNKYHDDIILFEREPDDTINNENNALALNNTTNPSLDENMLNPNAEKTLQGANHLRASAKRRSKKDKQSNRKNVGASANRPYKELGISRNEGIHSP